MNENIYPLVTMLILLAAITGGLYAQLNAPIQRCPKCKSTDIPDDETHCISCLKEWPKYPDETFKEDAK